MEVDADRGRALSLQHLRFGWSGLLVFALLGVALEALHAWKVGAYLGVDNETRRLMWTLAHAHGVGLSLLQIAYAASLRLMAAMPALLTTRLFHAATVLVPLGFFLGGVNTYEADPGFGVLLVPLGALALLIALGSVVRVLFRPPTRAR
jgi:putative Mn2+ efflux pump MntP